MPVDDHPAVHANGPSDTSGGHIKDVSTAVAMEDAFELYEAPLPHGMSAIRPLCIDMADPSSNKSTDGASSSSTNDDGEPQSCVHHVVGLKEAMERIVKQMTMKETDGDAMWTDVQSFVDHTKAAEVMLRETQMELLSMENRESVERDIVVLREEMRKKDELLRKYHTKLSQWNDAI